MTNIFVTEFSKFSENILEKLHYAILIRLKLGMELLLLFKPPCFERSIPLVNPGLIWNVHSKINIAQRKDARKLKIS